MLAKSLETGLSEFEIWPILLVAAIGLLIIDSISLPVYKGRRGGGVAVGQPTQLSWTNHRLS